MQLRCGTQITIPLYFSRETKQTEFVASIDILVCVHRYDVTKKNVTLFHPQQQIFYVDTNSTCWYVKNLLDIEFIENQNVLQSIFGFTVYSANFYFHYAIFKWIFVMLSVSLNMSQTYYTIKRKCKHLFGFNFVVKFSISTLNIGTTM